MVEAEEMNNHLKLYNIRENIPIQAELPLYIPSNNIIQNNLDHAGIRYEIRGNYHIFYLNYIVNSGCNVPVVIDTFCKILQLYETESRVISVPGKKPEKMTLPLIPAEIPNLGHLKFLAIPELPKYKSSSLAFNIIKKTY